jgi:predicted nucleotidyltransferase
MAMSETVSNNIDVKPHYLEIIRNAFAEYLPHKKVWAYGSRVKGTSNQRSDLDCVVFNATDREIYEAKEFFDNSEIPFIIQLLSWEKIPEDFKDNIKQKYFILQE